MIMKSGFARKRAELMLCVQAVKQAVKTEAVQPAPLPPVATHAEEQSFSIAAKHAYSRTLSGNPFAEGCAAPATLDYTLAVKTVRCMCYARHLDYRLRLLLCAQLLSFKQERRPSMHATSCIAGCVCPHSILCEHCLPDQAMHLIS